MTYRETCANHCALDWRPTTGKPSTIRPADAIGPVCLRAFADAYGLVYLSMISHIETMDLCRVTNCDQRRNLPHFPIYFRFAGKFLKRSYAHPLGGTLFVPPRTARLELPAHRNSIFQKTNIVLAQKLLGPGIKRGVSSAAGL